MSRLIGLGVLALHSLRLLLFFCYYIIHKMEFIHLQKCRMYFGCFAHHSRFSLVISTRLRPFLIFFFRVLIEAINSVARLGVCTAAHQSSTNSKQTSPNIGWSHFQFQTTRSGGIRHECVQVPRFKLNSPFGYRRRKTPICNRSCSTWASALLLLRATPSENGSFNYDVEEINMCHSAVVFVAKPNA